MTVELVPGTFTPLVDERFSVVPSVTGHPFDAVLSSVEDHRSPAGSFSLLFHSDAATAVPQQICHLRHAALDGVDLFLVPLGPDGRGMRYEAVIS